MVDLGQASTYAVFSGASVGNTVSAPGAPHTTVRGDLGVKANAQPTGFPPGVVTGAINVGNAAADQAHADLVSAYNDIAGRTGGSPLAGALVGKTISPGLHTIAAAASNTGTVTLDGGGDPNAVFVFQVNGALAFAAGSHVVLTNGAQASRVFWQVNGAGALGANATFAGTMIAMDAVGVGAGTIVNGRTFARNGALTLDNNQFYSAPPAVTITGGDTAYTSDSTPTISGTTDVEAPATVTVTIAGQTLMAIPDADGAWSVTSSILANGTYSVVASTVDGAGNQGSAAQQLTVDTEPPVLIISGGESVATNDSTPTISGISDVAEDTVVRITVGSQTLRALVQADGTWSIQARTLVDDTYTVTAAVKDLAGNETIDTQTLTVDTTAPALTITGGANALTNDATPTISGTAGVAPGTTVAVNLANETLIGLVGADGGWSVTASALSNGTHRVIASVSDAAGNPASFTQMLTVDTIAPVVTINGGATAATNDLTPTITGTSDSAPGTTVTVTMAGQTMTTLVQANGSWNVTPSAVSEGTYSVVASAPDPAGNVGSATQTLTVDTTFPNTTITSGPSGQTSDNDPSFAFSSSEGSSIFQCRLDGPGIATGSFSPCLSPKAYTDLADGSYTFQVRATDPAGNTDQSAATRSFTVDTTAPGDTTAPDTIINSGPSGPTSNNDSSFAFSSSEANSSLECRLDGPGIATGSFGACSSPKAYADLADGSYIFRVRATDQAGNTDPSPATRSFTVDTQAPSLSITSGPSGQTNNASPSFGFDAEAGSSSECSIDQGSTSFAACTSPSSHSPAAALSDGSYTFRVRAIDAAGNATTQTRSFTVDTAAPNTTISSGPEGPTANDDPSFAFSSSEGGSSFECRLDGPDAATGSFDPCTSSKSYTDLADGAYAFQVRATDQAGNTDPSPATRAFTIDTSGPGDTTAPETTISSGPSGQTSNNDPSFAFSSSEGGSSFECRLDGPDAATESFASCSSPKAYTDLADGSYIFRVRATDPSGNTDLSSATRSFTVDTTDPNTTIDSGPGGLTNNASPSFAFSSSEGSSSFECRLDGPDAAAGTFDPCTSSEAYTDLADGTYTFRVRAMDQVGNTDQTPASRSFTVDATAPETTITKKPGTTTASRVTFNFVSSEAGSTFKCKVDKKPLRACTSPKKFKVKPGGHVFKVQAIDAAGNSDPTPAKHRFKVK